jgi:dihydrofolate reductase
MTVSVFVGASVDGFIARPNGDLDWLPTDCEPHGYDEFIASVDATVIGRKTFETILAFEAWPYGGKRVVVLSSRPLDLSAVKGVVEQMGGEPAEIVRARRRAAPTTSTSTAGSRFNGFCARGHPASSSPACRS